MKVEQGGQQELTPEQQAQLQQQAQMQQLLSQATDLVCTNCESIVFTPVVFMKKISKMLTGAPQDMLYPVQAYRCADCGELPQEFIPKTEEK